MHLRLEPCKVKAGFENDGAEGDLQNEGRRELDARFPRSLDPNLFYLICGLSQAGRVSDQDREPADI